MLLGFPICKTVLYEYCKAREVKLKLDDENILPMIDPNLTVEDNHAALQVAGIRIGTKRINRLLKLARSQQAQQQAMPEHPIQNPCDYTTGNKLSGQF